MITDSKEHNHEWVELPSESTGSSKKEFICKSGDARQIVSVGTVTTLSIDDHGNPKVSYRIMKSCADG